MYTTAMLCCTPNQISVREEMKTFKADQVVHV